MRGVILFCLLALVLFSTAGCGDPPPVPWRSTYWGCIKCGSCSAGSTRSPASGRSHCCWNCNGTAHEITEPEYRSMYQQREERWAAEARLATQQAAHVPMKD